MNQIYLYVALVGVVLVLFAFTRSNKRAVPTADGVSDLELKQALNEFMQELDKENVQLLESFTKLQIEIRQKFDDQQETIQGLERRLSALAARQDRLEEQAAQQHIMLATAAVPEPELPQEPAAPAPQAAPSFVFNEKYAKVVELSRQGMSAEQIARETDIGIGEIHLVLDLARREER